MGFPKLEALASVSSCHTLATAVTWKLHIQKDILSHAPNIFFFSSSHLSYPTPKYFKIYRKTILCADLSKSVCSLNSCRMAPSQPALMKIAPVPPLPMPLPRGTAARKPAVWPTKPSVPALSPLSFSKYLIIHANSRWHKLQVWLKLINTGTRISDPKPTPP